MDNVFEKAEKVKYNQRLYQAGKAQELAVSKQTLGKEYGENPDLDWTETLYRKPTGEYFVIGRGGKDTPYGDYKDGVRVAGSQVDVWTQRNIENAELWIHRNCPELRDSIMTKETEKPIVVTFSLSEKARTNLKRKAKELGVSASELIRRWAEGFYTE